MNAKNSGHPDVFGWLVIGCVIPMKQSNLSRYP
jgi:hypothetical protein